MTADVIIEAVSEDLDTAMKLGRKSGRGFYDYSA